MGIFDPLPGLGVLANLTAPLVPSFSVVQAAPPPVSPGKVLESHLPWEQLIDPEPRKTAPLFRVIVPLT
jgi:hypothetical protein